MPAFRQNKSLQRYARTYLVLMLCVVVMVIPLYLSAYILLQRRELEVSSAMLQNGMSKLDQELSGLTALVQGSYADNRYRILSSSFRDLQVVDYFAIIQVQNDFKRISATQAIIKDCGILFNSGFVLTKFRNFPAGGFYDNYFAVDGLDYDQWKQLLFSQTTPALLERQIIYSADYGHYDALTWVSPVTPSESPYQQGYFYSTIPTAYLLEQLAPGSVLADGFVLVRDNQGNVLLNHQFKGQTSGFVTYESNSASTGLSVQIGIAHATLNRQLAPMRILLLIYLFLVLLLGILLSLFLAYRSSLPINQLVTAIAANLSQPPADTGVSDLDFIRQAFTGMNKTLTEYASLVGSQKEILRRDFFEKLLNETNLPSPEGLADFQKFFPDFPDLFQIALIHLAANAADSLDIRVSRQVVLQQQIGNHFPADVYTHFLDTSSVVILLPVADSASAGAPDKWFDLLCNLKQLNQSSGGLVLRIALSETFRGPVQLADAYRQARHILQLSGSDEAIQVWRLSNFPVSQARFPLDYSNLQQLYNALASGQIAAVDTIIQALIRRIREFGFADELIYQQIFYNLRGVLLSIKLEMIDILASAEIPVFNRNLDFMTQLADITASCRQICQLIKAHEPNAQDTFSDSVIRFINENLANQELYTKTVTQHFNIGVTTLQKILHSATGKPFFEYVEDHRIENAYQLLTSTNLSINEIAGQCGFASYNSLYKAFQRRYNISPGSIKNRLQE